MLVWRWERARAGDGQLVVKEHMMAFVIMPSIEQTFP
jgi:hypothetical protein